MTREEAAGFLVTCACRLVTRALFRTRILGAENIPPGGPALLVSNHLTYLDGFLLGSCLGKRIRFLAWKPYYDHKLLTWGFRLAGAIPICERPHGAVSGIKRARRELERGHVVCIFAEGSISHTGQLLPFKRGLEAIAQGLDAPIVPVHLGGLWESVFSYKGGRFSWKQLRSFRHPVVISFGTSMSPSSTAHDVRRAVQQLSAGARR